MSDTTTTVRAKFRCQSETSVRWNAGTEGTHRKYDFQPVYEADRPEDQRFAKATPSGSLSLTVDNPAVSFDPGQSYYLDITPAD